MAWDEAAAAEGQPEAGMWRAFASIVALLAAVLLITLVVLVGRASRDRDLAVAAERHSYQVMLATSGLRGAMSSAEAALGRFVISGDKAVGSLYADEWRRADFLISKLRAVVADNRQQSVLVDQLEGLYLARGKELAEPALRANFRQGWPALSLFNKAGESRTVPQIAAILHQLAVNERTLLAERSAQASESVAWSNWMGGLLSVLGMILAAGAALMGVATVRATAEQHAARRRLRRETERAETLEARVAERTSELEEANALLKREAAEREAAEAQLRQVQKMEAVGQLTGGIAHDFNNMLAVVVGGLDLARRRLSKETEEVGRHIDSAMEGANRAAALTRRLLAFARAEPLLPSAIDPAELVAGMSDLLDRTLGERVVVETRLGPGLAAVWVDPHQLENAILNLAVNARDAMDGEGSLVIAVENVTVAAGEAGEAPAGDYVRIAVQDRGAGMSQAVLERALEPFFTTKPVGRGTGLGLSQIFGFVRQSGGELTIQSVEGVGTTVNLYLPCFDGEARAQPAAAVAPEVAVVPQPMPVAVANEPPRSILLVEDDLRVRGATIEALQELGHATLSCDSGEEALALLARRQDIELVITDIVMPQMTGPELVRRIGRLYPGMKVLFVTGYVGEAGEAGDFAGHEILRKPFTIAALDRAVRQALAGGISEPRPAGAASAAG